MNIIWFSWKDIKHPQSGGAEVISNKLMVNLVQDGHKVTLITSRYPGSKEHSVINGVDIFRTGNRFTVYWKAFRLFRKRFADKPDLVIDEMNTMPFGCALYTSTPAVLLAYQLARKVWFYQMPFPLSVIGFLLEPVYLFVMSRFYKTVLTESESTRRDLQKYGFSANKIHVFRVGLELQPLAKLPSKKSLATILVLGSVRPMKRTLDAIKAFERASDQNPQFNLIVAGDASGKYGENVLIYCKESRHRTRINFMGRVSVATRKKLMRESSLILVTSVKEGWGLIVTEANSQGTPAIAYDCDGLRDSVEDGVTGLLVPAGDTTALGDAINSCLLDRPAYERLRKQAWSSSKQYTFKNSYTDFKQALDI